MKKKKGKQKVFLYGIRNQRKLIRNEKKRIKCETHARRGKAVEDDTFIGEDYNKVIHHLNDKKFALGGKLWNFDACQKIVIPEVFSMSEDTETAIRLLKEIFTYCSNPKIKKIIFEYSQCVNLGLSASTIMDIIILAVGKYREKSNEPLELEGNVPRDRKTRDILMASGLPYHLKADSNVHYDEEHVKRFETVNGVHSLVANRAGTVATGLTEYFNKCLKTQNMELNNEGLRVLSRILGEVITNCEIHGGESSTWYTQGHYQIEEDSYGEMQLLFLNLGETIYEGLKAKSTTTETKQKLHHVMKMHNQYLSSQWDEEMIYTVFALQEGISRLRDKKIPGYEGRGSGTVSMIQIFNEIGECKNGLRPQMTIVSGNTKIVFTDNYQMKNVSFNGDAVFETGEKGIIAFNDLNDIYKPADSKNVMKMKQYFPGTVISLKFYLDRKYISSKKKENR